VIAGTNPNTLALYGITDAVNISQTGNWNAAYNWGNHAGLYIPIGDLPGSTCTASQKVFWNGSAFICTTDIDTLYIHPNTVTASTYKSVTVNASGHVTAGTNPTTLGGYGITDAVNISQTGNWNTAFGWGDHAGKYRLITWVPSFAQITSTPTTLGGYGITDGETSIHAAATYATKTTTLAGYGITDAIDTSNTPQTKLGNLTIN